MFRFRPPVISGSILQYYALAIRLLFTLHEITVTSRDPDFVTPVVKFLLRRKNVRMPRGRIEEANAITVKVRNAITEHNILCFKGCNYAQWI